MGWALGAKEGFAGRMGAPHGRCSEWKSESRFGVPVGLGHRKNPDPADQVGQPGQGRICALIAGLQAQNQSALNDSPPSRLTMAT